MKHWLLALLFLCCSADAALAQKKSSASKKTTATKRAAAKPSLVEPPPVQEAMVEPMAETASFQTFPADVDTTAAPADSITQKINELLAVTRALTADVEAAEQSLNATLKGNEGNPQVQEFKSRFLADMREGHMRRWLRNIYIRQYRSTFSYAELEAMLRFYQSPVGRSIVQKQGRLASSVMIDAQKIGQYMGGRIMNEVMSEPKK